LPRQRASVAADSPLTLAGSPCLAALMNVLVIDSCPEPIVTWLVSFEVTTAFSEVRDAKKQPPAFASGPFIECKVVYLPAIRQRQKHFARLIM
jgi:hypothetical protein